VLLQPPKSGVEGKPPYPTVPEGAMHIDRTLRQFDIDTVRLFLKGSLVQSQPLQQPKSH